MKDKKYYICGNYLLSTNFVMKIKLLTLLFLLSPISLLHQIYLDTDWEEIPLKEYNNIDVSDRGDGMAGSTATF